VAGFGSRLSILTMVAVVLMPLAATSVPPLVDYPDHLARMLILSRLHAEPALAGMFTTDWHFIPNLAMEAVVLPLALVLPLDLAGRVFVALAMLLPVAGCVALHRALHPRAPPTPWPLAATLLACNAVLTFGLLGFAVGVGAALIAAAVLLGRPRPLLGALLGVAVFACHAVAFALLVLLLASALAYRRAGLRAAGATLGPLLVAPLALSVVFGPHEGGVDVAGAAAALFESRPGLKVRLLWLCAPFASPGGWPYLDLPVAGLFVGIVFAGRRRLGLAPEVLPALLALVVAWAILPDRLLGNGLMFERMAWPSALLFIAGTDPRLPRHLAVPAAAICAVLLLVRSAVAAEDWAGQDAHLADLRAVLADVPAGARVLAVRDGADPWQADPDEGRASRSFHKSVAYARLPALAITERGAFWPMLFTEPGKSPLRLRPLYAELSQHDGPLPLTTMLSGPPPRPLPAAETAQLGGWRQRYDYVLRLHPTGVFDDPSLVEAARAPFAVVYRVSPTPARLLALGQRQPNRTTSPKITATIGRITTEANSNP
jgi:hypothetical protein